METIKKPEHNRYDNIYEIRMEHKYGERALKQFFEELRHVESDYFVLRPRKPVFYHKEPESFLKALTKGFHAPVWKIVIPRLEEPHTGSIYYIARTDDAIHVFRGTFGYWGVGPHQSALIEEFLDRLGVPVEVRDGDYLLGLLGVV